ncbi:MAG TPA: hypothetical protein VH440_10640 [Candidatus Limnocylindrales bacterium]|jgi:hypothetical protein
MPHVNELTASHEQHDPLLMAALAAGDLAGAERERALDLTRSCAECAALHDDLVAIARATARVPPPMAMPARDFRLTPERAAGLRPAGWRRFFGLAPHGAMTRNVGVALATFGLAGLLIGTLPIGGSTASAPLAGTSAGGAAGAAAPSGGADQLGNGAAPEAAGPAASAAAASMAPAAASAAASAPVAVAPAPAASSVDRTSLGAVPSAASGNDTQGDFGANSGATSEGSGKVGVAGAGAASPTASREAEQMQQVTGASGGPSQSATSSPWSPLVIVSAIAIVLGAALFVLGRCRERDRA